MSTVNYQTAGAYFPFDRINVSNQVYRGWGDERHINKYANYNEYVYMVYSESNKDTIPVRCDVIPFKTTYDTVQRNTDGSWTVK